MGSKSRIVKHIAPIIQDYIDRHNIKVYIEPFVGGGNVIDHIRCDRRIGFDKNEYVVALLDHIASGGDLLEDVSREMYNDARSRYNSGDNTLEKWVIANIGFVASYNGRWFDGGYARPGYEKTKYGMRYRDYYQEAKRNLEAQAKNLSGVEFHVSDYADIDLSEFEAPCVIYCDPPYQDTKQFQNARDFDYAKFWDTIRMWSKKHYVLCSEMHAPDDFICIWSKCVSRSIKVDDKTYANERLFTYTDGIGGVLDG